MSLLKFTSFIFLVLVCFASLHDNANGAEEGEGISGLPDVSVPQTQWVIRNRVMGSPSPMGGGGWLEVIARNTVTREKVLLLNVSDIQTPMREYFEGHRLVIELPNRVEFLKQHDSFAGIPVVIVSKLQTQPAAESKNIPYKVDLNTAHALVKTGTGLDYREGLVDLYPSPTKEGFYIVRSKNAHGYFENKAGKRTPIYEWYAINAWTGDVWPISRCQRLSNPSLHAPLARIKALFNSEELKEYDRLSALKTYHVSPDEKPGTGKCEGPYETDYSAMGMAAKESVLYKVDKNTAYDLVQAAGQWEPHSMGMDTWETPDEDGFFSVDLYSSYGEGIAGRYDVNAWTGDVWDEFSCKRLSNPRVKKIQEEIKKRFTGSEKQMYAHLHDMRAHDPNLEPCP